MSGYKLNIMIKKKLSDQHCDLDESICRALDFKDKEILSKYADVPVDQSCPVWQIIFNHPDKAIRGKQLIEIIWKILNRPKRGTNQSLESIKENLFKLSALSGSVPSCIQGVVNQLKAG